MDILAFTNNMSIHPIPTQTYNLDLGLQIQDVLLVAEKKSLGQQTFFI